MYKLFFIVIRSKGKKRKKDDKGKMPKRQAHNSDSGAESENLSGSDNEDTSVSEVEHDSGSEIEENYEKELAERPMKRMRPLLPIKTKDGLLERAEECDGKKSVAGIRVNNCN